MRQLLLTLFWVFLTQPALALCGGPSFLDRLNPAEIRRLHDRVDETPFAQGLVWDAARGEQSLTLIGTIHIYDPRLDAVFQRIAADVRLADTVFVEATPQDEAAMQAAMAASPEIIFITDGPTLLEQLDNATWEAIAAAARARQIPPFLVAKMQPWYLSMTLAIPPCALPDLAAGIRGLDHMIMDAADNADVALEPLEPWTTLLDIMQSGEPEEQLEMLRLSLLAPDLASEMFVAMLDAYFAQDIATIWEASRLSASYVPGLDPLQAETLFAETEQLLLINRNRNWIPVINASEGRDIVVAVGAAHLPGEFGLINLLQQNGWRIERRP